VIDKSGSMQGQKIDLVIQSFTYLFELLGDNDRVAIITFNNHSQIVSHLLKTTAANKIKLLEMINSIQVSGSTNIEAGIHLGLKILKQRKYINDQASIFLLSDGIDDRKLCVKERVKAIIDKYATI
jgi:Ca-activated chloride channel family protein